MDKKNWNIFFTLEGPGGVIEFPNNQNPVECVNLASLLARICSNLPGGSMGVETIGIRVELADATEGDDK